MATIAIGDIHGNLAALTDVLGQVGDAAQRDDTIVFLGDYIDRGPDVKGCIDAILRFRQESVCDVVCLAGNHEDWFLETVRDHREHSWLLAMQGLATIESYSVEAARIISDALAAAGPQLFLSRQALPYHTFFDAMPPEHIRFFESLRPYHKTVDCLCSHGGLDTRVGRLEDQKRDAMIWGAGDFPDGYDGADWVVYGHWDNAVLSASGWPAPYIAGRTIGIDTVSHGVLTAVRLPDQTVFQSAAFQ